MPREIVQTRSVLLQSRTAYPRTGLSGPSQRRHHSSIDSTSSVLRVALPMLSGRVMTNSASKCKQRVSVLTQSSERTQAVPFLPYLATPLTAFALEHGSIICATSRSVNSRRCGTNQADDLGVFQTD